MYQNIIKYLHISFIAYIIYCIYRLLHVSFIICIYRLLFVSLHYHIKTN